MPNPVDVFVGSRVKLRRTLIGLSQEKLGDALGLTFQQVQKYERGANRIGASRLYHLSVILDVPISYFFDGYQDNQAIMASALSEPDADQFEYEQHHMSRRETIDLVRAFYQIPDNKARRRLIELVRSFADMWTQTQTSEAAASGPGTGEDEG